MRLLLTISSAFIFCSAFACDCNYGGPFLTMAPKTKLVALIKVQRHLAFKEIYDTQTPMSMEVEIIDTYKGVESRKTVVVWGDPGNLCRPYLSQFKEGQYYVIAFIPGFSKGGQENEKDTDYSISNCGAFWLFADINKKAALGDVDSKHRKPRSITFDKLKTALQKNGS